MQKQFLLSSMISISLFACSGDPGSGTDPDPVKPGDVHMEHCVPASATPQVLLRQDNLVPEGLVVDGTTLYFGHLLTSPVSASGGIYHIPTAGGNPTLVTDIDFLGGPIGINADSIVFMKGTAMSVGTGIIINHPNISILDKKTKSLVLLDNPPSQQEVDSLIVSKSGIYWGSRGATLTRSLSRWEPATKKANTLADLDSYSDIFTDDTSLFYSRIDGGEVRFETVPVSGGTPTVIKRFAYVPANPALMLGIMDDQLYFSSDRDGGKVETMSKTGGPATLIATLPGGVLPWNFSIDQQHIYWVDQTQQAKLMRTKKEGGTPELVADGGGQFVRFIATDACNVYWSVVNPPQIMVRRK